MITRVWLRAHPVPTHERRAAYAFGSFAAGVEACRQILQAGATPAVLRLYDAVESQRGQGGDGTQCMLLVLDEGDVELVDATMSIVDHCCLDERQQPRWTTRSSRRGWGTATTPRRSRG